MNGSFARRFFVATAILASAAAVAPAEFVVVEDFEALNLGPIDEQNDWVAVSPTSHVTTDPANDANQVLAVITNSTRAYHDCPLPNGTVRVLFVRFSFGGQQNYSFGMSDSSAPDQFGDFEVELSMSNASNELRVNDDGTYSDIGELRPHTWYHAWILINNATDDYQVFLHSRPTGPATPDDRLEVEGQVDFGFRDGTAGDLRTFYIKTGGGSSGNTGPLFLDNIYIESTDALNLENPGVTPPDLDDDGDVDLDDQARFVACVNGPEVTMPPAGCSAGEFALADIDRDLDVDLADFAGFCVYFDGGGE